MDQIAISVSYFEFKFGLSLMIRTYLVDIKHQLTTPTTMHGRLQEIFKVGEGEVANKSWGFSWVVEPIEKNSKNT